MGANLDNWKILAQRLRTKDRSLRPLIDTIGEPALPIQKNHFRALCESILSQQLAPRAADAIISRVAALRPPFPTAERMNELSPAELRQAGVSSQKVSYLLALVQHWQDTRWRRNWSKLPDEDLVRRLTEVRGIGSWTAHMFLIFALGRPDVLPVGDYGIQRGVQLLRKLETLPTPGRLTELAAPWEGARSVACWYLWQALDRKLLR